MGDRTPVTLYFYSCPPEQTWAIAHVVEEYELTDTIGDTYREGGYPFVKIGPGPWEMGYLEPATEYTAADAACGSALEIATFLEQEAPGARWDVWEDPQYHWMGERLIHDPDLGTWSVRCASEGEPMFTSDEVKAWVERALAATPADAARVRAEIDAERGAPWLELPRQCPDKLIIPIGYDHEARPDDLPGPGDECKDCGEPIFWHGTTPQWMHVADPRNT